jgi:hypothetical protein
MFELTVAEARLQVSVRRMTLVLAHGVAIQRDHVHRADDLPFLHETDAVARQTRDLECLGVTVRMYQTYLPDDVLIGASHPSWEQRGRKRWATIS